MSDEQTPNLPKPEIPGAKQTIKLRPSGLTPPPAGGASPELKRTIKLTPPPAKAPIAPPGVPTTSGRLPPTMGTSSGRIPIQPIAGHVPTSTGKVPVMRPVPAPPVLGVPTASGRMPSHSNTASGRISHVAVPPSQLLDTATASVPKVVPISENVASGLAATAPSADGDAKPAPAGKTLQLKRPTAAPSNPTVKLSSGSETGASAPTVQLAGNTPAPAAGRTLKLNKTGTMAAVHEEMKKDGVGDDIEDGGTGFRAATFQEFREVDDGPGGIPYAIIATVALLCIGFLTYASIALFSNLFSDDARSKSESNYTNVPSFPKYEDARKGNLDRR